MAEPRSLLDLMSPQYFMPSGEGQGGGNWPIGQIAPWSQLGKGRVLSTVREEMARQTDAAQGRGEDAIMGLIQSGRLRINPEGWQNFLANAPQSRNVEDRRSQPPVDLTSAGGEGADWPQTDPNPAANPMARALGYDSLAGYGVPLPLPRPRPRR